VGILNHPNAGPDFCGVVASDLIISSNCYQNEYSFSILGQAYGGPGVDRYALFVQ
jgi:microcystin-dependent protein